MKTLIKFSMMIIFLMVLFPCSAKEGKFMVVDLLIDCENSSLAAYQVELSWDKDKVKLVGIQGGKEPYDYPPYYDSSAFDKGRIIVAAFLKNGNKAKSGKILIAKLHILSETGDIPEIKTKLIAACKKDGTRFKPDFSIKINKKAVKTNEKTK